MFRLETPRLVIRDMSLEDEAAFVAISQDVKYQRFYDEADSKAEKYRQLTKLFIQQAAEIPRRSYQLAIEHKQQGIFIGTVCLRLEDEHNASMGCGIARSFQGSGLIHEAATALANYGFSTLNVHRIYAETIKENRAALKLCSDLGMRREAVFKENRYFKGRWWDTVVMAILQHEWRNKLDETNE
ncbi:GNAT family N-acetyltransferase [Vibrio coralliilyticus]|uniref:GNAT family N-acetyltransferase n=1 Tax=Vibrio coralliilyticus TaxID=190893 RepID=UPI00148C80D5|nr:GNAT family protein [Vibrio coralliilyticus]NOH54057.1 GNAT family N-acetyltransferase [Vibrio coralliilyticus]